MVFAEDSPVVSGAGARNIPLIVSARLRIS